MPTTWVSRLLATVTCDCTDPLDLIFSLDFNPQLRTEADQGLTKHTRLRYAGGQPHLIKSGRHAGRSLVDFRYSDRILSNLGWTWHVLLRDPFTSMMQLKLLEILVLFFAAYIVTFFFWAAMWYVLGRNQPECFNNFVVKGDSKYGAFVSALLMAVETSMTVGYGFRSTNPCWSAAWLEAAETVFAFLMDAVVLGVMFAKIAQPKYRARTIFLSDRACIARRDGLLKLLVRVADSRRRQVLDVRVTAHLYTWAGGHTTQEGERMPVLVQELPLSRVTGSMLLLPVVLEHDILPGTPLFGHTLTSLEELQAEARRHARPLGVRCVLAQERRMVACRTDGAPRQQIVVSFEGADDIGQPFRARRSYLSSELKWGHEFLDLLENTPEGGLIAAACVTRLRRAISTL